MCLIMLFVLTVYVDTESYNVFTKQNKQSDTILWKANINVPQEREIFPSSTKFQLHFVWF
jgi:hypothetical protein